MPSPGYSNALAALDAVVLDTETTGLDARSARLVQIGALRLSKSRVHRGETFERIVNPGVPIPPGSTAVHGIGDRDVAGAPRFGEVVDALEAFVDRSIVIGHTIAYDLAVLQREHELAGRVWRSPRALDVRVLARLTAPALAKYDLDGLCDWLGIEIKGRHTAMGDAEATAEVFVRLLPLLRARGIRTLAEAEAASREQAEREARVSGALPLQAGSSEQEPLAIVRVDSFAYSRRVRDVMSAPPLFAAADATMAEVVRTLLERKASSVFIRLPDGTTGIVTERDVLRAVGEHGPTGLSLPAAASAQAPLLTIFEGAFVYRAIGRMERLGIRHLGVRDAAGEIVGAVTTRNLLRHRATTAIMLGDEIDSAATSAELAAAWTKLPLLARSLTADAADPRTIAAVISSEIQILTRRAAQLAEESLRQEGRGPAPAPYCVLVLGSAGRGESLLAADQDNAIVYDAGTSSGDVDPYFAELGRRMCRTLDEAGVPYCKGGVMAERRDWRMSLREWRDKIGGWVRRQRPQDLLNVDIFFDAVAVHGDHALGDDIRRHAYELGGRAKDFQALLTEAGRQRNSPFTLLGGLRVDENGRLDLKKTGLLPIFTGARILSIRHGINARSTVDRLRQVAAMGIGSEADIETLIEAHRTMIGAALSQQLVDIETGVPPSWRIDPRRLAKEERRALSTALGHVAIITDLVSEGRL